MVKKVPPLVCLGSQTSALVFLLHNLPFDSTALKSPRSLFSTRLPIGDTLNHLEFVATVDDRQKPHQLNR